MNAKLQYKISAPDLETILALSRTGKLADAGERLQIDASTVFRALQKIEKGLGQQLFERTRTGYIASELAQELATRAENMEFELESARSIAQLDPEKVAGSVRITSTDTVLHGLIGPLLPRLKTHHPLLSFDLHTGNELASLTRRDADIAVRATKRPPQHLIGKHLGPIKVALYAAKKSKIRKNDFAAISKTEWIAPDEALPDHPSVIWRKKHFPKLSPTYRVSSILTVAELIAQGLGIGVIPIFLANTRTDLKQLSAPIDDAQTDLWLLTHTDARHLRRVSATYGFIAQELDLRKIHLK
jgi:DNA-binding transcriptional LysR family regulator